MTGKFRCFYVGAFFVYGQSQVLKRPLEGKTGVLIFGPTQDDYLRRFTESGVYNILFTSKKCVNPNYRNSGGRNTVVIFEERSNALPML